MIFDSWQILYLNRFELQSFGHFDPLLDNFLKKVNVSDLTRLGDAQTISKPLKSIVGHGVLCIVGQTDVQKVTADQGACAALSSIAVNGHNVLIVL
jgi:hypothetical protein